MAIPHMLHIQEIESKLKKTGIKFFVLFLCLLADVWERDLVELVLEVAVSQVSHRQRDMLLRQVAVLLGVLDSDIIVREISTFNEHRSVLAPHISCLTAIIFFAPVSDILPMALGAFHMFCTLACPQALASRMCLSSIPHVHSYVYWFPIILSFMFSFKK